MSLIIRARIIIALLTVFAGLSLRAETSVVGFQAWKAARVDDARANLEKLQASEPAAKGIEKPVDKNPDGLKAKVQQAQQSLDVAQELTVNEYFLLYLRQLKSKDSLVEATRRLSPEDMAELLLSYQKQLAGPEDVDAMTPSSAQLAPPAGTPTSVVK